MKESLPIVETTISHYRILARLGAGAMGEVYLAEDTLLDRKVAIKFLTPESAADEQAKKRLVREAKAVAKLDHPNICAVHEVGEADGQSFIVMQYVEGETLASRIHRKPTELKESLDMAVQVTDALVEAHSRGIIHRDIKPQNIMITPRGQVKVMDFGLARTVKDTGVMQSQSETQSVLTEPGTIMGTVPYMSPELVRGETVDARSDIFSFGAVLYEMVTGRQPFAAESAVGTMSAILTREPPPLVRYAPEAPIELQRIVSKALAKEREERFQTIKDLQIDLRTLKQEREFTTKQERSSQSAANSSGAATSSGSQAREQTAAVITAEVAGARTTSSAEYLVGEIKRHKSGTLLALAVLVMAASALVYFAWGGEPINSVAVLPFVNANGDPNTEYLADGIPESIINSLSQLPSLKVMSRNSAFHYKGREIDAQTVGRELKVQAVLTGRVTQRGDGLSINVELINALDNSQIWGEQYNRKLSDIFAVQGEIAKEISEKLRLKVTGAERQQLAKRPTENIKAFQYYMQGRAYAQRRTREDLLAAIRYCEKAIEEDRNYALAYAGLADAYSNLGTRGYIAPIEGRRKVDEAARKAFELDENLAEAHVALGQGYIQFAPYNFSVADRELRRAIDLSPSFATAHQYLGISLVRRGRLDEALEEFQKARELDPLSSAIAHTVAIPYFLKRDYVRALELVRQANDLGPAFSQAWEIGPYIQNRSLNEAVAELEKQKRERKNDPLLIHAMGMVHAAQGKRAEALQIIKELEEMSGASQDQAQYITKIYAVLNEKELALTWLERGLAAGAIGPFYKDEPVWDPIRSDPRFTDLLRRMGIPQ